ncbi:response regulator transcription factor [Roseospirillum parvum]|uniref:Two-component system, OmpR family, phosphate regulon response regulator OmpR n=1 Tax=Roseospirillum parvum TaxID=83401 RepID=A0A1G7TMS6_9PROT|nr:response regulator transcription factor [Roseospirillum parvum]SDG35979.1 two-component system, OmpR family, phosphate regulon response regulator OmpR [Roseospirillum parvum]
MTTRDLLGDLRHHILVVDDDRRLRRLLSDYLSGEGFMVSTAADAAEARAHLAALTFDLVVLDIMMPGESGLEVAAALRAEEADPGAPPPVPILLLTAMAEPEDRIRGLEVGVDDYLTKPFEPRELLLRINAILRRLPRPAAAPAAPLRFGALTFDPTAELLSGATGAVHLTAAELNLLAVLARHNGETISRDELAEATGNAANPRAVDVQVTRLRKKIEPDPRLPRYLLTVRGQGYRLRPGE